MITQCPTSRQRLNAARYQRITNKLRAMQMTQLEIFEFWEDCFAQVKQMASVPETDATHKHNQRRFGKYMTLELRKLGIKQELNID